MSVGRLSNNTSIFFGQSGSGKSTLVHNLSGNIESMGQTVLVLNDGQVLIELVKRDTSNCFHTPMPDGDFMVTDTLFYDCAATTTYNLALQSQHDYDHVLVEMSCGRDSEGAVDLSFGRRMELIPPELRKNAKKFYVASTYEQRIRHNSLREGQWRLPALVMERLFSLPDELEKIALLGDNPLILENNGCLYEFINKATETYYANIERCSSRPGIEGR